MVSLAADHDAEADERAETAAACCQRDRARNFERTGDRQHLMLVAGGLDRALGARKEHVVEVRIETRLDQQDRRHQACGPIGRSSTMARP